MLRSSSQQKLKYGAGGERLTLSDLSGPLHSFPDGEVDQDPGQGQGSHQGPAELSRLLQAAGELVHVASAGSDEEERTPVSIRANAADFLRASASDLLPELGDGAGEVGGVGQAVVREALLCVPGVVAALPR